MAHPFAGSWGYQVSGFRATTSTTGSPMIFVGSSRYCHQQGIGVLICDWVQAHFPKDDFSLASLRWHRAVRARRRAARRAPGLGHADFQLRPAVKCVTSSTANALFWLQEFHVEGIGLRVDAVASMLYLDYEQKGGKNHANPYGGRENIKAMRVPAGSVNAVIHEECPGAFTVAEESTAWGGVSRPPSEGGFWASTSSGTWAGCTTRSASSSRIRCIAATISMP